MYSMSVTAGHDFRNFARKSANDSDAFTQGHSVHELIWSTWIKTSQLDDYSLNSALCNIMCRVLESYLAAQWEVGERSNRLLQDFCRKQLPIFAPLSQKTSLSVNASWQSLIQTRQQWRDFTHIDSIQDALRHFQSTVTTIEIDLEKCGAKFAERQLISELISKVTV